MTIPLYFIILPYLLFLAIFVIFTLINLYHLMAYTPPSLLGFFMTLLFLGGTAYILWYTWLLAGAIDWRQTFNLLKDFSLIPSTF